MNDRPTPETDALLGLPMIGNADEMLIPAKHARHLERERDLWKAEAERWREIKGWQPIETAPRDGTEILVFDRIDRYVYKVRWSKIGACWREIGTHSTTIVATHWMPLPEPPQS